MNRYDWSEYLLKGVEEVEEEGGEGPPSPLLSQVEEEGVGLRC